MRVCEGVLCEGGYVKCLCEEWRCVLWIILGCVLWEYGR